MTKATSDIKQQVQTQFGPAANAYEISDVHAAGESLGVLAELLEPRDHWDVLDVATGAGHTALILAPQVTKVIALDLTDPMLEKAAELAAKKKVTNLECRRGDAEALPFPDQTFDLVTCRLAFHHFPNPDKALREFSRVLKVGGTLGFTDNLVVEEPASANYYNRFEKLRDPSHVEVYSARKLHGMFEEAGLSVRASRTLTKEFEFHDWADRQRVSMSHKQQLMDMMRRIPRDLEPLFRPRWTDKTMYFSLWESVLVATRTSGANVA